MIAHFLADIVILLAAAVVLVPVMQRLGLGSVLGYLAAGLLVGPSMFGFIEQVEEIRHIAELGVVFLLFIIGIELELSRLLSMRRLVFGLGTAQLVVTGSALTGVAILLGVPTATAVVIGFGLALSSTAFGLQLLTERGELGTPHGQTAFSVLLLQDLAVVPLLTLVLLLSADGSVMVGVEVAVLKAVGAIAGVILAGRYLLSPLLRFVATHGSEEVFTATALLAVLGTAWVMEAAGLSLALGAFLAGLMLADSRYRHQITAQIEPFRGILLGLFFMAVGMSIDLALLAEHWPTILALAGGLLALKGGILTALCRLMRVEPVVSVRVGLLLSQSGEFGFVLFGFAAVNGLMDADTFSQLNLVIATSMLTTPLAAWLGEMLERRAAARVERTHDVRTDHVPGDARFVIIAGFGRVGRRIARILAAHDLLYVAVESDPDRVDAGRAEGCSVFYGDASLTSVLGAAGAGRAVALVCTLDNVVAATRLVHVVREQYPDLPILTRGRDRRHCAELSSAGATRTISETLESSLQLGGAVLEVLDIPAEEAAEILDSIRGNYYE
ncbi:MAG: monovalent cation:proton antiporter-2 (CPA2) family protein [Planctomycetota bacterium]|jgi:monovalent cation:proton antiporter-2 (CPA2) family protein